ncbi:MAG: rhodanese-like domain-containing protein [Bacteroidales bacterium]|jgi:rhodanese-related sulfurtransferase|nr:rhodanese-like domain-containing protein [Bacteroidales bacterium]MCK9499860.1 rhodanese-like domain-containing protein [Bacteroidales bacterium]MDY0315401.1 rhodanese-like domain-containing protein [Bacteroidales bacterium]NLB86772.1 rhodanese-like domain-containing protein [Bacteroidales bacterium]
MRNNQLLNLTLLFFLIILGGIFLGFITNHTKEWKISNSELQSKITDNDFVINYADFEKLINMENLNITIIDLRDSKAFDEAHIENASNIPADKALEDKNIKILKNKENQIILYSDNQSESALYMAIYTTLGIENINILAGNYETYTKWKENKNPANQYFNEEKMRWNYKALIKQKETAPVIDLKPMMTRAKGGC